MVKQLGRLCLGLMVWTLLAAGWALSQRPANPRGEAVLGEIQIDFGRPSTQGRDVLALMVPGGYWRLGADINTTLRTGVDLRFGDQTVPAGTYVLLGHLRESGEWELVVCGGVEQGPRPRDTVAVVPLMLSRESEEIDRMEIELRSKGGESSFLLSWGIYRLRAPFSIVSGD